MQLNRTRFDLSQYPIVPEWLQFRIAERFRTGACRFCTFLSRKSDINMR